MISLLNYISKIVEKIIARQLLYIIRNFPNYIRDKQELIKNSILLIQWQPYFIKFKNVEKKKVAAALFINIKKLLIILQKTS